MKSAEIRYIVIIGDIVDSKKIKERLATQRTLLHVLEEINTVFEADIASKFSITLGDEFQGLLKSKEPIISIIERIEMALGPVELRFGIGSGAINTDINYMQSSEIDGPAYHRARKMLEEIKNRRFKYSTGQTNILICTEENNPIDELVNSIFAVCSALRSKWTTRQKEIITAYLTNGTNQYKAAESLGIGQSSVNKALDAAKFYNYKSAMSTVDNFFKKQSTRHE